MAKKMMTRLTHAGENNVAKGAAKSVSMPKVMPIYMSSVFAFDDVPSLDAVYDGSAKGFVYSRMGNPTYETVCDVLAKAEEADEALVFSSGMAAIIACFLAFAKMGDHIISSPVLYGGVYDYLKNEAPKFGIEVDFVDFIHDDVEKYVKPNTKIVYTETISNPLMEVVDIKKIAGIAHKHGAIMLVDNTFATPAVYQPMKDGVDVVAYSATKYLGGHSDIISGAVVGNHDVMERVRRVWTLYGGIASPFDAWLLTRSLRTLDIRMKQHSTNALRLAEFFEKHPKVERVYYPGLASAEDHALAMRMFTDGMCGGMLSCDFAGGEKAASDFIAACESVKFVPSLAGVTTSISYPYKTSHRAYSMEELQKVGISTGQLRFSTGLENIEDIIEEFEAVLKRI